MPGRQSASGWPVDISMGFNLVSLVPTVGDRYVETGLYGFLHQSLVGRAAFEVSPAVNFVDGRPRAGEWRAPLRGILCGPCRSPSTRYCSSRRGKSCASLQD